MVRVRLREAKFLEIGIKPTLRSRRQKRVKLRNSEYYNHQDISDELYDSSLRNENFYELMDLILDKNNINLAYRNIKGNTGSNTAGVDGLTIKDISELDNDSLYNKIVKRFE